MRRHREAVGSRVAEGEEVADPRLVDRPCDRLALTAAREDVARLAEVAGDDVVLGELALRAVEDVVIRTVLRRADQVIEAGIDAGPGGAGADAPRRDAREEEA